MNDTISKIRKKYLECGYSSLTDSEKIILTLSYSEKGNNAEISAAKILELYGNLHTAADSDAVFLMKECDISQSSAVLISLISELKRRSEINLALKNKLNTAENAKKYFSAYLMGRRTEYAVAAAVNKKFGIVNTAVLAYGGFSEVHISIRTIIDFALKNEAKYIFISHCHPKDKALPSPSDINTTREIKAAIESIGIVLADHIITGNDGEVSLRELNDDIFSPLSDYITNVII